MSNIAKSVYYYWINQLNKPNKDKYILQAIKQICKKCHYTYGYRRVTQVLSSLGFNVNHKKVLKLMQSLALTCKKFTHRGRRYS
ncbi:IS3 family transposase, partial [Staphylococcus auricularis]|uniref:IS3 family transposase n=1 Tax=Staphylococcus auricularis TaxID=29379 RepID=UPI00398AB3D6